MQTLFIVGYATVCVIIALLVILQQGKTDVSMLGGGGAQNFFRSRSPVSFFFKLTVIFGLIFLAMTLYLDATTGYNKSSALNQQVIEQLQAHEQTPEK